MHIPSVFCEEDFDNIIDFIAAKPLATIIAQTSKGIEACHIPLFYSEECSNSDGQQRHLYGHFGRKNPIYLDALADTSWLIIFKILGIILAPTGILARHRHIKKYQRGTTKACIFSLRLNCSKILPNLNGY